MYNAHPINYKPFLLWGLIDLNSLECTYFLCLLLIMVKHSNKKQVQLSLVKAQRSSDKLGIYSDFVSFPLTCTLD